VALKEATETCPQSFIENRTARNELQQLRQYLDVVTSASAPSELERGLQTNLRTDQSEKAASAIDDDRKAQTAKPKRRNPSGLTLVKDKFVCAITAGLTKLSSLVFDQRRTGSMRRARQCR
jgi:hypothetical protein